MTTASLPATHPLRQADWVWPEYLMYLHNHFAQFRWDFKWNAPGDPGVLYITADKSYRLYVNGRYVTRGPARGYQSHWPFDEVPLAGLLRPGRNWISVEAYQTGCSTFQYLHEDHAGLLMTPENPDLRAALKNGRFAMRRSPGHRTQTARLSLQIDYQEHLDLRLDDRSWITGDTPPENWKPYVSPPPAMTYSAVPFSRAPWYGVEPRGIPLLRETTILAPQQPTYQATGTSAAGYQSAENVSWHWIGEQQQSPTEKLAWHEADAKKLKATRSETALTLTIPATGPGTFHAFVLPVGAYVAGFLAVRAAGAKGGEILDFQFDQYFRDGKPHFLAPGAACLVAMGNRLTLRPGDNAHEFYHPLGFGVVTLVARDLTAPLEIQLGIRTTEYPFTMRGTFESSDQNLNDIHAICRRTQQLCAFDAYMDTPWREQAQWWGDARVQARNTFYLDGDARLLARGIRSIAGQNVGGLTPGHAPTCAYTCVLPDFSLTWVMTLWDYYWQTGDLALFEEHRARIDQILAYFDTPEARHPSGLLRHDKRYWLFEDWAQLPKDTLPTFLNLSYLLTLRHLEKLSAAAKNREPATRFKQMADRHESLVKKYLFDPTSRLFHPALNDDLVSHSHPAVHDHTLALMLNLYPEHHAHWMDQSILPYLRNQPLPGATPSAFWATYPLEEAINRGHAAEAVDFIATHWKPFLATGTTWEHFTWEEEGEGSACHAWTSHPSYHLVNAIAGLHQTAPAWKSILFKPDFLPHLEHASALVPSPAGDIKASWRRDANRIQGTLELPPGVTATIALPGQKEVRHDAGAFTFDIADDPAPTPGGRKP